MRFHLGRQAMTAACALVLLVAPCGCATDAGTGAAVAIGALSATGVGAQLATHSTIKVTVDTFDAERYRQAYPEADAKFALDRPLAIRRTMETHPPLKVDPVKEPSVPRLATIRARLAPVMENVERSTGQLREMIGRYQGWRQSIPELLQYFDQQLARGRDAMAAWQAYRAAVDDLPVGGHVSEPLHHAARTLARLRESLERVAAARPPDAYLALVDAQLFAGATDFVEAGDRPRIQGQLAERIKAKGGATGPRQHLRFLLQSMGELLATLPEQERKRVTAGIDNAFRHVGSDLTAQDLMHADADAENVLARLESPFIKPGGAPAVRPGGADEAKAPELVALFADLETRISARNGVAITFGGITSGANVGPISNEVFQVITTAGDSLARLTRKDAAMFWNRVNSVRSRGGPGNLDSVVYLENMAMPVLKSSTFDPTKFIVANGMIYRKAFAAAVEVFGVPVSTGDGGGSELNMISQQARVQELQDQRAKVQGVIQGALEAVLQAEAVAKTSQQDDATWTQDKGETATRAAAKVLGEQALKLEQPSTSSAGG